MKTIKLLTLYSINSRQPIAFTKQPGNLPDVTAIENALNQLSVLGITDAEIVTDNGYYSETNLPEMLQRGFDFIILAKNTLKWIRPEIDKHMEELGTIHSVCPFDISTHGIMVMLMHEFDKVRKPHITNIQQHVSTLINVLSISPVLSLLIQTITQQLLPLK